MSDIVRRAQRRLSANRQALIAKHPRLLSSKRAVTAHDHVGRTAIVLGRNQSGGVVEVPQRARLEHTHVIGTTGGGKSKLLEHMIRQDIADGRGVCVVDPHGNHPDSLYRSLLSWLDWSGCAKSRTIHLLDPNASTHTVGFNPLALPDIDTDLSVIAGVTLEAFSRAWGGEDTSNKPTIERILTVTFTALVDLGLTLVEAPLLYDREDRHGLRSWAIKNVSDRYTRDELLRLHELSLDERRRHDFDIEVVGPINRIARFIRPASVRAMIGQSEKTIDFRAALDEGHIILANLSGGSRVYERDADLLGRLLTRSLFFHAKRRHATERPFFVYLDECHRYLSGDLENILAEVRKYGLGIVLANQWLGQFQNESEAMLAAVRNATNLKIVFRLKDPAEAEDLAQMVIPLDLEVPVNPLVKPTVVGHRRVRLRSEGASEQYSTTEMRSQSVGTSEGESHSWTKSVADTVAHGESAADSVASSIAEGTAETSMDGEAIGMSTGMTMLPTFQFVQPPNITGFSAGQMNSAQSAQGLSKSQMKGESRGKMNGRTIMRARAAGSAEGSSVSIARHSTESVGRGETIGTGRSEGEQEAFEPLMAQLPSAVHGKENVLYMAAQTLRNLTTGHAFVNFVDATGMKAALLTVPKIVPYSLAEAEFVELRRRVLDGSPSAVSAQEARERLDARERTLIARADAERVSAEPDDPGDFRHKKKRSSKLSKT